MKLSLFTDDMILYIENLKDAPRKLLELINEFGKVRKWSASIVIKVLIENCDEKQHRAL